MSDYTVLSDVGEALRQVLWDEVQPDPQVNSLIDNIQRISLQSPFDLRNDGSVRLSIYLYRVSEDPYTKNRYPVEGAGLRTRKPPLSLDLFYMVTPLVGTPPEQQIVLGKAMQVFYDRALLEGTVLQGNVATSLEQVRVMLSPVSLEETARVWQALEMSYRLSVCYTARVAFVDSTRQQSMTPVRSRTGEFAAP